MYKADSYSDLKSCQKDLQQQLIPNEFVVAESGYKYYECLLLDLLSSSFDKETHGEILARHENENGLLMNFKVWDERFRHNRSLDSACFHAVGHIVELTIMEEKSLKDVYQT